MNRVHHVTWCLEPENMDAAKEMWEQRLGVELIDFVLEADGPARGARLGRRS